MAEYEAALKADASPVDIRAKRTIAGTVNAALVSYFASSAFRDGLSEGSQKMRRPILERFREKHGDKPIALMHRQALQVIVNGKKPAAQSNFKKAMRGFLNHCIQMEMLRHDQMAGVSFTKIRTKGHHPWEAEECAQYEARRPVGTNARLAYELLLQAGQSRCDVVRRGRQHVRGKILSMPRQKTGKSFTVEITPRLTAAVEAMPASNHMMFLITSQGKPFSAAGFGNWFRDRCDEAGLPSRCTSHGLRKAATTYLAEHGATDRQLMAVFGWSTPSQATTYTRTAEQKVLAQSAAKLISGTGIGSPTDPVSQNDAQVIERTKAR